MAAGNAYENHHLVPNNCLLKQRNCNNKVNSSSSSHLNLKSGYVPIDDLYLYKTGIRGHKKYTLYVVVLILFVIALVNLMTTFVLLGALRLGYGLESLEFIPPGFLLRFLTDAEFDTVVPTNGIIGGFKDCDLNVFGNEQSTILQVKSTRPTAVVVDVDQTTVMNVDSFKVVDPNTGKQIFSTEYTSFGLPKAVKKLNVKQVKVNKIESPVGRPLSLGSKNQVRMRGNEGLHMSGMELILSAGQDVFLKSRNSSITLNGSKSKGVVLIVEKLPKAIDFYRDGSWQYKICVCMPSGRLFRIPLRQFDYTCANADISGANNPCI